MNEFTKTLKNIRKKIRKTEKVMTIDGDGCYEELEKQYMELVELSKIYFKEEYKGDLNTLLKNHASDRSYSLSL